MKYEHDICMWEKRKGFKNCKMKKYGVISRKTEYNGFGAQIHPKPLSSIYARGAFFFNK
jgi:hypothetical protein